MALRDLHGWRLLLSELHSSTERLSRLIGQFLSLAGSETALTMDAEHRPQDIVLLLREATEPLMLQGLRQGRNIELHAPAEPVVARAHPIWLGEVVNNLLDNAQRYGGPNFVLRVDPLPDGGTGLGLAIAREIVLRLGGTLSAATRPEVGDMRFTVRLAP